ncbi:MAG: protein-L-isoaspartate(D-aspartate) O-methyltransferase [Bacillota bacterium]|jgi:protein-L-isoaspartate(D-aspartate) O-methyltransferase|nr:protein-L-isoaspartate(D-aspartate) O-methyltransferase [Clostridia bacterium]
MDYHELLDFYHRLDRSYFIDDEEYKKYANLDRPLPIGYEQTISQPSLVLKMTRELDPDKTSRVLEIGTGSGYQTALLAEFSHRVYTVERIKELSEKAKEKLDRLGYTNIRYKIGDGSEGWSENAPYDRIIVTAAAERIPDELISQLKPGGKLIIPVGPKGRQELQLITKDLQDKIHIASLGKVIFVEMKGKYGWTKNVD